MHQSRRPRNHRARLISFIVGVALFMALLAIPVYLNNFAPPPPGTGEPSQLVIAQAPPHPTDTPVVEEAFPTATATEAPSPTGTATSPPTSTATETVIPTPTNSPTAAATESLTTTVALTATATLTNGLVLLPTSTATEPITATETSTLTVLLLPTNTVPPPATATAPTPPADTATPTVSATPTPANTLTPTSTVETPSPETNPQIAGATVRGRLGYQEKHYILLAGIDPNAPLLIEMVVSPANHPAAGKALTVFIVAERDWEQIVGGGVHPEQAHREVGRIEGAPGRIRAGIAQPNPPYYVVVVNDDQQPAEYTLSISNGVFGN